MRPRLLMYHSVCRPDGSDLERRWALPPERLEAHLRWLRRLRIPVVPLTAALEELPGPAVILTFDDAFRDFRVNAWPLLQAYGCPAAVMAPTALAGGWNSWDQPRQEEGRPLLSWDDLRELAAEGVTVGAHGHRHVDLRTLGPAGVREELGECVARFRAEMGAAPRYLAYPYNQSSPEVEAAVQKAGFTAALGGHWARGTRWALPRGDVSAAGLGPFLAQALGGYTLGRRWKRWLARLTAREARESRESRESA